MTESVLLVKDHDNSTEKNTDESAGCQINERLYQRRWVRYSWLLFHGNWQNITGPNPTNVDV